MVGLRRASLEIKGLVKCLGDPARSAGIEADENKIEGGEADQRLGFGVQHFVADLKAHSALALDFAENMELIIGAGGLFVFEAGGDEDRAGIPFLEIGKYEPALEHVIVAGALAVLKVNRVVHMPKRIDIATAHPQF
jgi:hypothetical protein